jgi:hypothetical protein
MCWMRLAVRILVVALVFLIHTFVVRRRIQRERQCEVCPQNTS